MCEWVLITYTVPRKNTYLPTNTDMPATYYINERRIRGNFIIKSPFPNSEERKKEQKIEGKKQF